MAPFISRASSKADRVGEDLLLELEALNQALHARSKSLVSYAASPRRSSELKPSCKHPLQPRPSFKVPFRSTSISCDRPKRLLSSSSIKQSQKHHHHTKKETTAHLPTEKEEDLQVYLEKGLEHCKHHENGHQHQKSRGPPNTGKGGPPHTEKKGQEHSEKKGSHYDQIHQQKSIWRWRPLRALSHIILGSHCRLNVLFSLQVRRIESLPVPMNGLSLTVLWIFKRHCLQTTPSRIVNGIAEFGETLRHQCRIQSTRCSNNISKYDAKQCTLSIMAPDLNKLELARNHVDLSSLLPQDGDADGNLWQNKCHDASYALSGMAMGGTLIVTFCHNIVQEHSLKASHGMQFTNKKTTLLTKSLPLSNGGAPLVASKTSSSTRLSERGAAHSMGHLIDNEWDTLQDSFTRNEAASSDDLSDSFEFKPPLKDNCLVEFSASPTNFITTDDSKKYIPTLYGEGLPPLSHTIHAYEDFIIRREGGKGTHKWSEQLKLQKPFESSPNRLPSGSLSFEEARCMRQSFTDFDDDLDSVAEEFLNTLGIGFDAGHHNSEADSESPRERLLRQFENDSLFM